MCRVVRVCSVVMMIGFLISTLSGCLVMDNPYSKLPPGPWRGVLKLEPDKALINQLQRETRAREFLQFDEVTEGDLPFNFEVKYVSEDSLYLVVKNGKERLILDEISYRYDRATNKDTIIIGFPPYDSYIEAIFEDNIMEGNWVVPSRGPTYKIGFVAHHGQDYRFTQLQKKPASDLTGNWSVTFGVGEEDELQAIGEFRQNENHLLGTFITETGDYRFLEGTVQNNKVYLSAFDGSHMFLFEAMIMEEDRIEGIFRSGTHFVTTWVAIRGEDIALRSADTLAIIKNPEIPLSFEFTNQDGTTITLEDEVFQNKPKVIQLMGSWCPNCRDETEFLVEWLDKYNGDVAVLGLAFERHQDKKKAWSAIEKFRTHLEVPYPIVLVGSDDKVAANTHLPMLDDIAAFPTLLFLDRDNYVKHIHTGFNGPATPRFKAFREEFNNAVSEIAEE